MPIWSANDDPTGRPNYANVATVYGVDKAEAAVKGAHLGPGWVNVNVGTGPVVFKIANGGSGYANANFITVDGGTTPGVVNATANIVVGQSANLAGTLAVTSALVNVVATGVDLTTVFTNNAQMFVYTDNSTMVVKTINKVTNSTSMNVVGAFAASNAASKYGLAGVIQSITNIKEGSGFTTTANVTITGTGVNANVVTLGGRAGRTWYEHMVVVKGMKNDAADDTVFPDS